jgi:hypothetical protein
MPYKQYPCIGTLFAGESALFFQTLAIQSYASEFKFPVTIAGKSSDHSD